VTGNIWHGGDDYDILGESRQLREGGEGWLRETLGRLGERRPVAVDFGCWSGRHLRLLERVAAACAEFPDQARESVIGIDEPFAEARVAEARRANPGFQIFDSGIANTGLGASSVDAGICWRVLHNLVEPGELTAAVGEIRRVMRHGAPLVAAVRAAVPWMTAADSGREAPIPILQRTYSATGERTDLYFSERACRDFFWFYGFEVADVELFREPELLHGHQLTNDYWMIKMTCDKERGVGEVERGRFISHPGDPHGVDEADEPTSSE
jgi:SAM-dependent methyltransferase